MNARLQKWFSNPDGQTRYRIILDADEFVECPTKFVRFSAGLQVVSDSRCDTPARWQLTVFGEERVQWFVDLGVEIESLPWEKEVLNTANGIHRADSKYMRKKDLMELLNKVMVREVEYMGRNALTMPQFRNLKLK